MGAEFEQQSKEQAESLPLKIQPGKPTVVDGEFILQVHFGKGELRLGLPAKIGIFALSQTQIQREDTKDKQAKSQKRQPVGKVTFLSLSLNKGKILIGKTNVVFKSRTFDSFDINIPSLSHVDIRVLDHDLDAKDRSEAQSILNPDWFKFSEIPATEEDIKNRKRFETTRALENFQRGAVTPVESVYLKRKALI